MDLDQKIVRRKPATLHRMRTGRKRSTVIRAVPVPVPEHSHGEWITRVCSVITFGYHFKPFAPSFNMILPCPNPFPAAHLPSILSVWIYDLVPLYETMSISQSWLEVSLRPWLKRPVLGG